MIHNKEKVVQIFKKYEERLKPITEMKVKLDSEIAAELESIGVGREWLAEILRNEDFHGYQVNYFRLTDPAVTLDDIRAGRVGAAKSVLYQDINTSENKGGAGLA